MSQHDFNIANQGFPATRADINNAFAALASTSSGATAPSTTFANQFWYDTANNLLMFRNEADSAWITLAYLDQATNEWEIRSAVIQAVDSAGVIIKTDDGTSRITVADDGTVTIANALIVSGNFTVDNGTIKLDGNYPTGTGNVALGDTALDSVQASGTYNTAIGHNALTANTTATNNVSVGAFSLALNTTGEANTAVGLATLDANTTGSNNVGFGRDALGSNTTASYNTAVGHQAGFSNTTAADNLYVGALAGYLSTGANNTMVGMTAGQNSTSGTNNTYVGKGAGYNVSTGSKNTIIGRYNGNQGGLDIRTSSNNIVLSDGDGNPRVYVDSSGNMGVGTVSVGGTIHGQNSSTTLSPFYGVTSSSSYTGNMFKSLAFTAAGTGWNHFIGYGSIGGTTNIKIIGNGNLVNTNNSYGAISDLKLKENIIDSASQWDDIKALTVRKYSMKADNLDAPNMLGVIAQEVEAAGMSGLVYETPDRDINDNDLGTVTKQVNYSILYMKAVKALQEAMDRIETLEAKVTALENA